MNGIRIPLKSSGARLSNQSLWRCSIYQRRTKNGIGRRKKTVALGTVKTQRVEAAGAVSAIVEGVRFFFISLCLRN